MKRIVMVLMGAWLFSGACSGGTGPLSKQEFLEKGNAVCVKGEAAINAAASAAFPNSGVQPDADTIRAFVKDTYRPLLTKQIDDLDALKPPKELQVAVDAMLDHARSTLAAILQQVETDPAAVFDDNNRLEEVSREAATLGLTDCGPGDDSASS